MYKNKSPHSEVAIQNIIQITHVNDSCNLISKCSSFEILQVLLTQTQLECFKKQSLNKFDLTSWIVTTRTPLAITYYNKSYTF